ncbi:MAG: hypothetical protein ACI9TY_001251 [Alphaproteobacteria bacterium]|jgi:hypothetical protein
MYLPQFIKAFFNKAKTETLVIPMPDIFVHKNGYSTKTVLMTIDSTTPKKDIPIEHHSNDHMYNNDSNYIISIYNGEGEEVLALSTESTFNRLTLFTHSEKEKYLSNIEADKQKQWAETGKYDGVTYCLIPLGKINMFLLLDDCLNPRDENHIPNNSRKA